LDGADVVAIGLCSICTSTEPVAFVVAFVNDMRIVMFSPGKSSGGCPERVLFAGSNWTQPEAFPRSAIVCPDEENGGISREKLKSCPAVTLSIARVPNETINGVRACRYTVAFAVSL
jgi:hypothetical protein